MNPRILFRAQALTALATDARMRDLTQISAWAGNIQAEMLPVIGVVTPQERARAVSLDSFERSTLLQVVVKRLGADDLEATLDQDADAIEACVVPAIREGRIRCIPQELTVTLNGEGEQRIGTLIVNFLVTWQRPLRA